MPTMNSVIAAWKKNSQSLMEARFMDRMFDSIPPGCKVGLSEGVSLDDLFPSDLSSMTCS